MLQPKLYLCPTPIGNMEDMTLRALRVLRECHRIYCEDTRNTGAMLSRLGISKPLISCHEHNEEGRAEEIAGLLGSSERTEEIVGVLDGLMADFSLSPLPGEPSCREDLHPFNPEARLEEGDIFRPELLELVLAGESSHEICRPQVVVGVDDPP